MTTLNHSMIRILFINVFLHFCCHSAQSQIMKPQTLIGKWTILDSSPDKTYSFQFADSLKAELTLNGIILHATYSLLAQGNKNELLIQLESGNLLKFVILEMTGDALELCYSHNYERAVQAKQIGGDKISWGWDNPIIILNKQETN